MNQEPKYIINPRATKQSVWMPLPRELFFGHGNSSYLNSLWLGFGYNVCSIPYRFVAHVLWPIFNFHFFFALVSLLAIPVSFFTMMIAGVMGQIRGLVIPAEILKEGALVLAPLDSQMAMLIGMNAPIIQSPVESKSN